MSFDDKTYQQIDQYLAGTLPMDELLAFENRLAEDIMLQNELELQAMANEAILANGEYQLHVEMKDLMSQRKAKVRNRNIGLGIGAIVVISLTAFFLSGQNPDKTVKNEDPETESVLVADNEIVTEESSVTVDQEQNESTQEVTESHSNPIKQGDEPESVVDNRNSDSIVVNEIPIENTAAIETVKEEPEVVEEAAVKNLCADLKMEVRADIEPSCGDQNTGSLTINVSGGKAPYTYNLNGSDIYETSNRFPNLGSGYYSMVVKDANTCYSSRYEFEVGEKNCQKVKQSFDPNYESWTYKSTEGTVTLYVKDRAGNLVFEKTGKNIEWNGRNKTGAIVKVGSYIYMVYRNQKLIEKEYVSVIY